MKTLLTIVTSLVMGLFIPIMAQSPRFMFSDSYTNRNKNAEIRMEAMDFIDVLAFQGSLGWNVEHLSLDSIGAFNLDGMTESAISVSNEEGVLSFVWYEEDVVPLSLQEKVPVFTLYFSVSGEVGSEFKIESITSATPWLVVQSTENGTNEYEPDLTSGNITVIEPLSSADIEILTPSCHGGDDGEISIIPKGGLATYSFEWNSDLPDQAIVRDLTSGVYNVTITDVLQDTISLRVELEDPDAITFTNVSVLDAACSDSLAIAAFDAIGGVGELEYFVNSIVVSDVFPKFFLGDHRVEVIDEMGCSQDSTFSVVLDEKCESSVLARNVLTLNGDGVNDILDFGDLSDYNIIALTVFNRWGIQLYNNLQYNNDWDGRYNDEYLDSGDYYYILRLDDTVVKSVLSILNETK